MANPSSPKMLQLILQPFQRMWEFRLLGYIDPYGDTYFDQVQMEDFLVDWDKLRPSGEQREQWKLVRNIATRCHDEVHLYLRFIGD